MFPSRPFKPTGPYARRIAAVVWLVGGVGLVGARIAGLPLAWSAVGVWSGMAWLWALVLWRFPRWRGLDLLGLFVDGGLIALLVGWTGGLESPFAYLVYLKVLSLYGTHMDLWNPVAAGAFVVYGWGILGGAFILHPTLHCHVLIHGGGMLLTPLLGHLLYHELVQREHDPLTGTWNRRMGFKLLQERVEKGEHPLLVFMDLDNFKAINDRWGHAVGDEVLTLLGTRLYRQFRSDDLIIRYGGDEFIVATRAPDAPRRIREIFARPFQTSAGSLRVQASFAVSPPIPPGTDLETLFRELDQEVYRQKGKPPESRPAAG